MIFTPEELEELRRADAEIEESYRLTNEDIMESRKRDREAVLARKDNRTRRIAAQQAAYREANREKYNAYMRDYLRRKRAASRSANPESGR